jgi:hypothetical protein
MTSTGASLLALFEARDLVVDVAPLKSPYSGLSLSRIDLSDHFAFPSAQEIVYIALAPGKRLDDHTYDLIQERISAYSFRDRPKILEYSTVDVESLSLAAQLNPVALLDRRELAALDRQQSLIRYLRRLFSRSFAMRTLNPYVFRGPVTGRQFFGRDDEIASLRTQVHRSFVISGVRRSGKTSLLVEVKRRLSDQPAEVVVYVTFETCTSLADIPRTMLRALPTESDDYRRLANSGRWDHAQNLPHLKSGLLAFINVHRRSGRTVRFFFDEYDRAVSLERNLGKGGFTSLCREILADNKAGRLAAPRSDAAVQFAFSGSRLLYDELLSKASPFHNFGSRLALHNFDLRTLTVLITEPLRDLGVKIIDPPRVAQAMLEVTGGHPSTSQHLCSIITDNIPVEHSPEVGVEQVQRAGEEADFLSELRNTVEKNVSPLGRFILALITKKPRPRIDAKSIRGSTVPYKIRLDNAALNLELAGLVDSGYLTPIDSGASYKMAIPILRRVCASFDSDDLVTDMLALKQCVSEKPAK